MTDSHDRPDEGIESALNDWLRTERLEKSTETVRNYETIARYWQDFCDRHDISTMVEVDGRDLLLFKSERMNEVATSTVAQQLSCLRVFLGWCQQVELVDSDLLDRLPNVSNSSATRDEKLDADSAQAVLEYYSQFEYASRPHAFFTLIWHATLRTGAMRAPDLEDSHLRTEEPHIELHHRPHTDTPLKNDNASEREVNLRAHVAEVLADYAEHHRPEVTDDHGQQPIFTTVHGGLTHAALAHSLQSATRPCQYGSGCPHDRDIKECPASSSVNQLGECPSTVTGHPLRRGSITHAHLDEDVTKQIISDRAEVSVEVIDKHYDRQDESTKRKLCRDYLPQRKTQKEESVK